MIWLVVWVVGWLSSGATRMSVIEEKEQILDDLINTLKDLYKLRCSFNCSCYKRFCPQYTPFHPTQCSTTYGNSSSCSSPGRMLDFSAPSVMSPDEEPDDLAKTVLCWSSGIAEKFANYSNHIPLWRYLGTPQGILVNYPGSYSDKCTDFDPRTRPWYVAATSGPKDVIILMDLSGSMNNGGCLQEVIKAAKTVLNTLTMNDYVGVIYFSSGASIIGSPQLVPATISNLKTLNDSISTLPTPKGTTNYKVAFQAAFQMINLSRSEESTSGCGTMILLLTGDQRGDMIQHTEREDLLASITNWNTWKARIFTYTFGPGSVLNSQGYLPKEIACSNQGVWGHKYFSGGDMEDYFKYLASLFYDNQHPIWVEPYDDALGVGKVITVAKAFYDETVSPPLLLGVVGIDLLWSEFQNKMGPSAKEILDKLIYKSAVCHTFNMDNCTLDILRSQAKNYKNESSICSDLRCTLNGNLSDVPQQSCMQPERDHGFCNLGTGVGEMCCPTKEDANVSVIVGCVVGISVGVIMIAGGLGGRWYYEALVKTGIK